MIELVQRVNIKIVTCKNYNDLKPVNSPISVEILMGNQGQNGTEDKFVLLLCKNKFTHRKKIGLSVNSSGWIGKSV